MIYSGHNSPDLQEVHDGKIVNEQQRDTSLEALRENFDFGQVIATFLDRTLGHLVRGLFPEKQSEQVRALDHAIGFEVEVELCRILGVDYVASGYMREEHRAIYERKCRIIQQHTDDPEFVEHALDTVTNQAELTEFYIMANAESISAALLSMYRSASGTFTILVLEVLKWRQPLRRNKAEQYRHAGITFEGIELPTKIAKETIAAAEKAAAAKGYDNFGEKHNALASKFHFAIKRKIYPNICTCNSCALNVKY